MHELVARIREPELCYVFARNATRRGHEELARQAYRHAVDLRAASHLPASEAELAALKAIYAYEEALSHVRGRRTKATGTWQLVNRHGLLRALDKRLAGSGDQAEVLASLRVLGMEDYSFGAVRDAFPERFESMAA